ILEIYISITEVLINNFSPLDKFKGAGMQMEKIVTVIVCPNCENEMTTIAETEFGKCLECPTCKKRCFEPKETSHEMPITCTK
ncbi:MAG: hypothetical protein ACOWWH_00960, partial [Eubacteriaceae bacterium]